MRGPLKRHPRARARRFVHLAEHQRHLGTLGRRIAVGVLGDDARFQELVVQVVPLARALADAREHADAAVALGDVVDQFLDQHRLAHPRAAEQADLAAARIGGEQIDDLDARHQNGALGRLIDKRRRGRVDGAGLGVANGPALVDRLADHVHDAAERLGADRHADLRAGIEHLLPAHRAVGRVHGDRAHDIFAQMLRHFEHEPPILDACF